MFSKYVVTLLRKLSFKSAEVASQCHFKPALKKNIFEKSWQLGEIPKDWQTANKLLFSRTKEKTSDFVYFVYFDFSKAFNTDSHNICIDKLMKFGQHKPTVGWIEDWLNCWVQRVAA